MATARRADMFTEDGQPSDDDPREHRARLGDERTTLVEALRAQRLTLELKCEGLDAEQMARRPIPPSTLSLLGIVRHLAEGERGTFRVLMAGEDAPRLYTSETNRDGDFDDAVADAAMSPMRGRRGAPRSSLPPSSSRPRRTSTSRATTRRTSTAAAAARSRCARCSSG